MEDVRRDATGAIGGTFSRCPTCVPKAAWIYMQQNFLFNSTCLPLTMHKHKDFCGESVVVPAHPVLFIAVPPFATEREAADVAIQIGLVGFVVSVVTQAGLESLLLATGDIRVIQIRPHRVTSWPRFGVIDVAASPHAAVVQPVVRVAAGAVVLALRRAAAKAPVAKLPRARATQGAGGRVPLPRAAQAGVVEGAATAEAQVVQVKVQEAALRAGKRDKSALCVPAAQVVVVTRRSVGRRAQEGGVLGVWACRHQVVVLLGANDVVDVGGLGTGARLRLANLRLLLFLPPASHAGRHKLRSAFPSKTRSCLAFARDADATVLPEIYAYFCLWCF